MEIPVVYLGGWVWLNLYRPCRFIVQSVVYSVVLRAAVHCFWSVRFEQQVHLLRSSLYVTLATEVSISLGSHPRQLRTSNFVPFPKKSRKLHLSVIVWMLLYFCISECFFYQLWHWRGSINNLWGRCLTLWLHLISIPYRALFVVGLVFFPVAPSI